MLEQKQFYQNYDIASATYTYGKILEPVQGEQAVSTSGSSTTVAATIANRFPFDPVQVGDILLFYTADQTCLRRKCTAKASGDSITVDSAITLTACVSWYFLPFQVGTAVTDGWHECHHYEVKQVRLQFTVSADASGFSVSIEIKNFVLDTAPVQILTKDYVTGTLAAPLDGEVFVIPELAAAVRVGLKGTGFAGTDNISAWLQGMPRSA